jgi:hypothetical protein
MERCCLKETQDEGNPVLYRFQGRQQNPLMQKRESSIHKLSFMKAVESWVVWETEAIVTAH